MFVTSLELKSLFSALWFSVAIIIVSVVACSLWFLWPSPFEFPIDDTYIHFVYAQNLAKNGTLMFNFTSEQGVGSTSLLWVLLLAGGKAFGISMHILARVLGMASLTVVGVGLYLLLHPIWRSTVALIAALLVVLSGNMLWFALSGMETVLFLALGILALLLYRQEKWIWLGIVLGLLPLARPEGAVLALSVGIVELWHYKDLRRGFVVAGGIFALISAPWFGYLFWRTGYFLPTSAIGKSMSSTVGLCLIMGRNNVLATLCQFSPLVYVGGWLAYLVEFVLGGMALPLPHFPVGDLLNNANYTVSVWAIVGLAGVIGPLLWLVGKRIGTFRYWSNWIADHNSRPIVIFGVWLTLHNLSYMIFLPIPGTASRYGAVNHIALWLALAIGLVLAIRRIRLWQVLATGLGIIATANIIYWNNVYDANLDYTNNVRIPAAQYVHKYLPSDELCAAFDVGVMRYYSERPIIDLGGLIDPEFSRRFVEGESDKYLLENDVTCLILPTRTSEDKGGWFDFIAEMGLDASPLFKVNQVTAFRINYDRWLQGYLPTNNYQAAVTVYQLSPLISQSEAVQLTRQRDKRIH